MLSSEVHASQRTYKRQIESTFYDRSDIIGNIKNKIMIIFKENNIEDIYGFNEDFFIETITDLVEKRKAKTKAQCLNPIAFIFGYLILKKIDNKKYIIDISKLTNILNSHKTILKEGKIEAEELIRYARYWVLFILQSSF